MNTDKQLNLLVHLRRKHDNPEYNIHQQTILRAATIHKDDADNDDDDGKDTIDDYGDDESKFFKKVEEEEEVTEEDIKPVEKTWEEKEEEIIKNTVHVVLEKDLDESDSCIFCLGGFKKGQKIAILGCLCKFCEECFNDYMASNPKNACPVHHKY